MNNPFKADYAKAGEQFIFKRNEFFRPGGLRQNLIDQAVGEGAAVSSEEFQALWNSTIDPPKFVRESLPLTIYWAARVLISEHPGPTAIAAFALTLYFTGACYYTFIAPLLR